MRNPLKKAGLAAAALTVAGVSLLAAAPANALEAGESGTMMFSIASPQTVAGSIFYAADGPKPVEWTMVAPNGVSFDDQTSVRVSRETYASNVLATGCVVSVDRSTLTCTMRGNQGGLMLPDGTTINLHPTVTVDPSVAPGVIQGGSISGDLPANYASVGFVTLPGVPVSPQLSVAPKAPVLGEIDNSSGSTVIRGEGYPGAIVEIKNPAGDVIGSGTVGADGTYEIDLGADMSGTPNDLSLEQSFGGVTSKPVTIDAANLPIIAPVIAGGAGIAAAAALGTILMVRRSRAAKA
jgi:hypothetical protein